MESSKAKCYSEWRKQNRKSKLQVKIWQQQDDEKEKSNKNESNIKPKTIKKTDKKVNM